MAYADRESNLHCLRLIYPDSDIQDTPDDAGDILSLAEQEIIVIGHPEFHGPKPDVLKGAKWEKSTFEVVKSVIETFHKIHTREQ